MNFSFYIARRYIFSKKSTHAINVISLISVIGVAVATMALVVVMSGFNGFADLVASFFTGFDPQIKIEAATGKAMPADDPLLKKVKHLKEVAVSTECVEDQALAVYHGNQKMIMIKGMEANLQYGLLGVRVAQDLGTGVFWRDYLYIYAPQREGQYDPTDPTQSFVKDSLISPGLVFQVKQNKYDGGYIITSLNFARRLFNRQGQITSLELRMKEGVDINKIQEKIKSIVGSKYTVKNRYEQQADTFNIMKIEKLFAYIFLSFILMVACFNIIGSLSMLMIDKKNDVQTLRCLGASEKLIVRIFLFEGRMISLFGAIIGISIGLLLCWLQQVYGIVKLGDANSNFVVNAYPVSVHPTDIVIIFFTVIIVGWVAVWYPVRHMSKKLIKE